VKRTRRERGKAGREGKRQGRATAREREGEERSEETRGGRWGVGVEGSSGNITSVRL